LNIVHFNFNSFFTNLNFIHNPLYIFFMKLSQWNLSWYWSKPHQPSIKL